MNRGFGKGIRNRNIIYLASLHVASFSKGESYDEIKLAVQFNFNEKYRNRNFIDVYYLRADYGRLLTDDVKIELIDMEKAKEICYTKLNEREKKISYWCQMFLSENRKEQLKWLGKIIKNKKLIKEFEEKMEELSKRLPEYGLITKYDKYEMEHRYFVYETEGS